MTTTPDLALTPSGGLVLTDPPPPAALEPLPGEERLQEMAQAAEDRADAFEKDAASLRRQAEQLEQDAADARRHATAYGLALDYLRG